MRAARWRRSSAGSSRTPPERRPMRPRRPRSRPSSRWWPARSRPTAPSRSADSTRAGDRALELRLPHLRPALDVELAGLLLELLARRLVAAADLVRLDPERSARAARQVLQRLLALGAGLRLLDVALGGGALLLSGHVNGLPTPRRGMRDGPAPAKGSPRLRRLRPVHAPRVGDDAGSQEESCDCARRRSHSLATDCHL